MYDFKEVLTFAESDSSILNSSSSLGTCQTRVSYKTTSFKSITDIKYNKVCFDQNSSVDKQLAVFAMAFNS